MKLTFLGTGTSMGVPVIACPCAVCQSSNLKDQRLRSSVLIESEKTNIAIDSSPDFRQQMLTHQVKNLDAIVFTHEHRDHTAGLDDVRAFNFQAKKDMALYATKPVQAAIKQMFPYIFKANPYPGIPKVAFTTIHKEAFSINGLALTPIQVMHHQLPVLGFRMGDLTYITDANFIEDQELEKVKGSKILILNALRQEKHISHFTLQEAVQLVERIEPEQAYFTHVSHQMGLHKEINAMLPPHISLAYDGQQVEF